MSSGEENPAPAKGQGRTRLRDWLRLRRGDGDAQHNGRRSIDPARQVETVSLRKRDQRFLAALEPLDLALETRCNA
jgi:hypothetical protein